MKEEVYEASLEPEVIKQCREDLVTLAVYKEAPTPMQRLQAPLFDLDRVWKLMDGAIDVHVHSGPDAYCTRVYDELELSMQACQAGMQGIVHKCHSSPTARSASIVQKAVNQWAEQHNKRKIDIFGGVVLNYAVGGLNPEAVAANIKIGGKFVWMPNLDASHHRKVMGLKGGIEVLDENDNVVPPLREIFSLIAEADVVLSLCHQSTKERLILIDEAKKQGVKRIELVHPIEGIVKMTPEQMKLATDKGAYLGMYCINFEPLNFSWDLFMEAVGAVGCDKMIAGTDCGHYQMGTPVDSLRVFIAGMLSHDISDEDVKKIVKINARNLLY